VTTRREILTGGALSLAALAAGSTAEAAGAAGSAPPDLGRKVSADGRVLPFAGNTVICHLPQHGAGSEAFDALLDIYRALPGHRWARKIVALPPSSYHMTIFGGANDKERRYPLWPTGVPLDLPMAACNALLAERLRDFVLGDDGPPYRMRVDLAAPRADERPLTVNLVAADADTAMRLRRLRDRLSVLLGIRSPAHAAYRFHVTLGYQFAALAAAEDATWRVAAADWRATIARRAPVITLGAPEFCLLDGSSSSVEGARR
jgi:hypothetical protein